MKPFNTLLIVAAFLSPIFALAQMDHVQGELIIQLAKGENPKSFAEKYADPGGIDVGMKMDKLLSSPMNIYLFEFDGELVNEHQLLREVRRDRAVLNAQFNHYVYPRETIPNDPNLNQQWHHVNTGANGGTEDADIDTDLAWDITTGGVTALGDTIVVCIIEGGNLLHPDLIDNAWFNHGEIDGNGIDDDGNGYIDDYRGWNVANEDDSEVYLGGHGTNVMGMIGAKGDNELGAVGANWNVKMMSVTGENLFNEASVVEAYTYPLIQRQIFNETNGDSGAFVVATNASWGIDNGNPAEVPIWSAFYDTLGVYGILNCGATANNNVNIDIVGDIPTGVESPYMISVTATNNQDVRTFSGYGIETIDVGAPGQAVHTTSGQDAYTNTSGTSFASPLTAGVIALIHSTPCPSFAQSVKNNPQLGADLVRFFLFEGVDPIPNLAAETVTGGRINAFNSISLVLESCGAEICLPPFGFSPMLTADTVYTFNWINSSPDASSTIRYRFEGGDEWTYLEGITDTTYVFDTLAYCAVYEFQIATNCNADTALEDLTYGSTQVIETLGCCIAPAEFIADDVESNFIGTSWPIDFNIEEYEVYYRIEGEDIWSLAGISPDGTQSITGLDSCTTYELLVKPSCSIGLDTAATLTVRTLGCGHCLDTDFCEALGESTQFEYIEEVSIGDYTNNSGNNGGYALFESTGMELEIAGTYNVVLTPGFEGNSFDEFFRLWIDLNQDGTFTENEILISSASPSTNAVVGEITIPEEALLGATRMRVSMKYVGFGQGNIDPCEIFEEGETEDYCITIVASTIGTYDIGALFEIQPFPNPGNGTVNVEIVEELHTDALFFTVLDLSGKAVYRSQLYQGMNVLETELSSGAYIYTVTNASGDQYGTGKLVFTE